MCAGSEPPDGRWALSGSNGLARAQSSTGRPAADSFAILDTAPAGAKSHGGASAENRANPLDSARDCFTFPLTHTHRMKFPSLRIALLIAGVTLREITHTGAAYLIDSSGYERALFLYPFETSDVVAAAREMLKR